MVATQEKTVPSLGLYLAEEKRMFSFALGVVVGVVAGSNKDKTVAFLRNAAAFVKGLFAPKA